MKKILLLVSMIFLLSCILISCGGECEHDFEMANCQSPQACKYCGLTEGEIGGHIWENSTCLTLGECKICGITEEKTLGHDWTSTLCTMDKKCRTCGETQKAKKHTWSAAKCLETPVCLECGYEGEQILHQWIEATCLVAEHCKLCGEMKGEALGHDWKVTTCKNPKVCLRCAETSTKDLPHEWVYMGCDKERNCTVCLKDEGFVFGHRWVKASCTLARHCENCELTSGEALGHTWTLISRTESICEDLREIYSCDRCKNQQVSSMDTSVYDYHTCNTDGLCTRCKNTYDTVKMTLDSILIENEHFVECCGIFTTVESSVKIYKPVTYQDVGMPVVNLGGNLPTSKGKELIVDFTYASEEISFVCTAEIKVQGASSAGYPKKNFNIKLLDEDGLKNKVELCDSWGREHKYCMKANYIDFSQSRNVVSGKIFGEIVKSRQDELLSTPNGGAIDGFPILVYNNGVYQGVYTMNIPKDKWMFDMHDSDEKNQAMIMTETWNNAVSFREISTSGFVLEYASNEDSLIDNNTDWAFESILDLIEFVYNNDGEDFKNGIHQYADIEKCIDSMIYTFFICADDNTSKNILWVTLDGKKWFSSMYDMDGTWGMRWNGKIEFNENTLPISALEDGKGLAPERNPSTLNLLWQKIYINYFDLVCKRYTELRKEILTLDNISNHFREFFDSIPEEVREAEKLKWTGVPSQTVDHLTQILTFAEKRLIVMDEILLITQ